MLWPRDNVLLHSALSPDAKALSGPDTVVTYRSDLNVSPALLASGGSLRALFSGSDGPVDEILATATSTDGGKTWSPAAAASNAAGSVYAAIGVSAALLPDGTPVSAWGSPGAALHIGLDASDPDGVFPAGALADPGVGVDAQTGQAVVAWNRVDEDGLAAMATGRPVRDARGAPHVDRARTG